MAAPNPRPEPQPLNRPVNDEMLMKRENTAENVRATYFEAGLGACGWWNSNDDHIIALNSAQFNNGEHCGKWLGIWNPETQNIQYGYVADECPSCGWGELDLSPSLFGALSNDNYDEGVFNMNWWWTG
ncbi:hypothetical protein TREMEDRAFT_69664 [Tremella mesenterica DSM 1558]|uniref:uncharacterized protein n=1 Tax=Tremella mesenterica (strain ATCC 24925 / CBS 8224 / DSM 1558 / NBRC 9311 / NRRL Y-6157 / RJB 2259-6 / UBC 559-6) TaxID=578456 RepID=UPI0003F4A5A4|nr:uncharacterized protein TREMEDRAFT_69664 [Tremella mesenterica DSM 1558]EIW67649.1 hypothetical protein TREMEDRAFT_69664 [Tremella mesenterica DSM 1558]